MDSYSDLATELNDILETLEVELGDYDLEEGDEWRIIRSSIEPEDHTLLADDRETRVGYQRWITEFWRFDQTVNEHCSESSVRTEASNLVFEKLTSGEEVEEDDLRQILNAQRARETDEIQVLRPIIGARLEGAPVSIGPCGILRLPDHLEEITDGYPAARPGNNLLGEEGTVARVVIEAAENPRAIERATDIFREVENVIRFYGVDVFGPEDAGIIDIPTPTQVEGMAISPEMATNFAENQGPMALVALSEEILDSWPGLEWIGRAIASGNRGVMERRVLSALAWAAQARQSSHEGTKMAQLMFAIEALLQRDPNEPISPGIMAALAETIALLLEEDSDSRLETDREVRRLYGKRSAVVHGRESHPGPENVKRLSEILNSCVIQISASPSLRRFGSFGEVVNLIKQRKYESGSEEA